MSRSADARFALAVVGGRVDLADPGIAARLAVLRARHLGDNGLRGLIDRAAVVHAASMEHDLQAVDMAYMRAVAEGALANASDLNGAFI
jgi:hypothetical protein